MQNRFKELNFDSAGITPILQPHMDRRSEKFLQSKNIIDTQHLPKKIDHKIVINSKIIYAMDVFILMELNKMFPRHRDKFKLFNYLDPSSRVLDPYKFNDQEYLEVMCQINRIVEKFDDL